VKKVYIGFVTCTVLTFTVATFAKDSIPNQNDRLASHDNESHRKQTNLPKAIPLKSEQDAKPQPPPAEERNKTIYESKTETDWWARITDVLVAVGTIVLAVVGWLGVRAAVRTLKAIERQAEIMENQRKSVAGKERPHITIKLSEPTFNEGAGIVNIMIDCQCSSPAFVDRAEGEAYIYAGEFPRLADYFPLPLSSQIYVTALVEGFFPVYSGGKMATIDISVLRSKKLFLYCHGIIEYRGVHLLDDEEPYRTPFSKRWIVEEFPIPGMSEGYWEDYPNAEANRQT